MKLLSTRDKQPAEEARNWETGFARNLPDLLEDRN
jgi:hypothetical protein